ncbi:DUF1178 family protein [Croceicoccus pelagius]|uniref:DUF1178 family protein n=1 Tax=Croceicoccus pelagius TaxID=1703341 RepID=A0A916YI83_9SPHN|nr:DUF1178 family protein [Croceicoccus pelagius]GGD46405.1 hypothetical protein GCM10010989_20810 [Croceicoccus pelagius]
MIVFDLSCQPNGHRFEAWFRSSDDYARQKDGGLLVCPECGSPDIEKAVMAPSVGRKGNQVPSHEVRVDMPAEGELVPTASVANVTPKMREALVKLAALQKEALEKSRWVGGDFADEARAMHYGEREAEAIHGEATGEEVEELLEEGVEIAPLPFPVAPPDIVN